MISRLTATTTRERGMICSARLRTLLSHLRGGEPESAPRSELRGARSMATAADGDHYDLVCVGGGNSAGYLAKTLVDLKWNEGKKVAIVSAEPVAPYERPALSKAFLHPPGAKVRARLPGFHTSVGGGGDRQTPEWYDEHQIDLMLSTKAVALDAEAGKLTVQGAGQGEQVISFDKLVLATGAKALTPGDIHTENPDLNNVFTIREEAEALEMVETLEAKQDSIKNIVIVGGGYIGMETAAAFSGWGFNVTMAFPEETLMQRLFPASVAAVFENYFSAKGINVRKKSMVTGLVPSDADSAAVGGVKLKSGEVIEADAVIFGVGSRVDTSLAESAVATGEGRTGGYAVNASMRTSKDNVYAIGDIAALDGKNRYEHVDFCRKSAAQAAHAIAEGRDMPDMDYLPYFYSRLFEYTDTPLIFQFYGDSSTDGVSIEVFGNLDDAKKTGSNETVPCFGAAWVESSSQTVRGLMCCNGTPEQYDAAKKAVLSGAKYSPTMLD